MRQLETTVGPHTLSTCAEAVLGNIDCKQNDHSSNWQINPLTAVAPMAWLLTHRRCHHWHISFKTPRSLTSLQQNGMRWPKHSLSLAARISLQARTSPVVKSIFLPQNCESISFIHQINGITESLTSYAWTNSCTRDSSTSFPLWSLFAPALQLQLIS